MDEGASREAESWERFTAAGRAWELGAPGVPTCSARTKGGAPCPQPPLRGGPRCLRHAGPKAALAHRERQRARLATGGVTPAEWARAEARRARNKVGSAWRSDPSLPGATIELGPEEEARFRATLVAACIKLDALLPALSDWLRWRFRRCQVDRTDNAAWERAVRLELPKRREAADRKMAWRRLGRPDLRTKAGRLVALRLAHGNVVGAKALAEELAEAKRAPAEERAGEPGRSAGREAAPPPLPPARPWQGPGGGVAGRRALPDRRGSERPSSGRRGGREERPGGAPCPEELAALQALLRRAGPELRARAAALPDSGRRLGFLRALRDMVEAPGSRRAQARWLAAVMDAGEG